MAFKRSHQAKPYCRSCRVFLNLYELDRMHIYMCARCDSKLIYLSELQKKLNQRTIAEFRSLGQASGQRSKVDCGICSQVMSGVQLRDSQIHLDMCLSCQAIWFGGAGEEYEQFLLEEISLSASTRSLLKRDRVGELERDSTFIAQNYSDLYRPLQVSHDHDRESEHRFAPHVSGYIFLLMILITVVAIRKPDFYRAMALSASYPNIKTLSSVFTSFFVHADLFHLIGNAFFYFMFADGVERKIGARRFIEFLIYAQVAGAALFLYLYGGTHFFAVGASVGVAALMTYYVMSDPYRPMRKLMRSSFLGHRFRQNTNTVVLVMPAWTFLIFFLLMELFGLYKELQGQTNVSHAGHLMGVLVGLLFFYIHNPSTYRIKS